MAGNIQNVNIAKLGEKYNEYSAKIRALSNDLRKVYEDIRTLRNYWTGKRMNAVIEKYNSVSKRMIESVNFFNKVAGPALLEIKVQYSNMEDKGVATNVGGGYLGTFDQLTTPIELTSTENVKFEQDSVTKTATSIEGSLENVSNTLKSMVNILDDVKTASDSLSKLVTNYNAAAETVIGNITEIKESLKEELKNAIKVVQTTEGYNDSDASRVQAGK